MATEFKPITVEDLGLTEEQKKRIVEGTKYLKEPTIPNSAAVEGIDIETD